VRIVFYGINNKVIEDRVLGRASVWDFRKHIYEEAGSGIVFSEVYNNLWISSENAVSKWNAIEFEQSIRKFLSLKDVVFKPIMANTIKDFFEFTGISLVEYLFYKLPSTEDSSYISAEIALSLYGGF